MYIASNQKGTAEARAILDHLPELYFAVLKSAHIEQPDENAVRCSFELPVLGKRTKTAPTAIEAIHAALLDLADVLTKTPTQQWPEKWRDLTLASSVPQGKAHTETTQRFQAKSRQFTIGVTMPISLKLSLETLAKQQETTFADVTRRLTSIGFEDFDERSFSEASESLLTSFSSEARKWHPAETAQVMVRLDQHLAIRLRTTAKEFGRSASEFCAMCVAYAMTLQTQIADIAQKIVAYRGPAARRLAVKVGIGEHVALLSGILAGSIVPPKKVMRSLSETFEAPESALGLAFRRTFESRSVPAFKAEDGKPHVSKLASSWEKAVRSLDLSEDQTKNLLQLDDSIP